jgi:hypothetical protein
LSICETHPLSHVLWSLAKMPDMIGDIACPVLGIVPSFIMRRNDEYGQSLTRDTSPCLTGLIWM